MRPITTNIKLKPEDLVFQAERRELLDFMIAMDLQLAETDFTLELIQNLTASLANDMDPKELTQFLQSCDPSHKPEDC